MTGDVLENAFECSKADIQAEIGISMSLSKSPLLAALACICVSVAGCAQFGSNHTGVEQYLAGDYKAAHTTFTDNNDHHPNQPMTQYNLGMTDAALGDRDAAISEYRQAAATGQGYVPDIDHEDHHAGATVAVLACGKLAELNTTDASCGRDVRTGGRE